MKDQVVTSFTQQFKLSKDAVERQLERLEERLREESSGSAFNTICREIAEIHAALEMIQHVLGVHESFMLAHDSPLPAEPVPSPAYAKELKIDADFDLSPDDGFYHLEHDAEGAPYRWTGPEHNFGFDLFIDRSESKELELRLLRAVSDENVNRMRCIVDEQEVLLRPTQPERGWILRGVMPPTTGTGRTRLSFLVPEVCSPKERNPKSTDERKLGVAFVSLIVRPEASTAQTESRWDRVHRSG